MNFQSVRNQIECVNFNSKPSNRIFRCAVHVVTPYYGRLDVRRMEIEYICNPKAHAINPNTAHIKTGQIAPKNISYAMMRVTDEGIGCQKFNNSKSLFPIFKENGLVIFTRYWIESVIAIYILYFSSHSRWARLWCGKFLVWLIVQLVAGWLRRKENKSISDG